MAAADTLTTAEQPRRRRVDGFDGRVTRDRLSTMLVLAAMLHGLVLLGVTFSAPGSGGDTQRGLQVLLVSDELPEARDNRDAPYLAQRSQEGSGNTKEDEAALLPGAEPRPMVNDGQPLPDPLEDQLLTTSGRSLSAIYIEPAPEPELVLTQQELERLLAGDEDLRLRGDTQEQLYLSPDTRASRLAPYLDAWRRQVEQVGTLNFPALARQQGLAGSLVLEVVINEDGRLRSARIQRTSGHVQLDEAARGILKLASPFDPFPPDLARDYRSLRFAYEWRFEGGQSAGSSLRVQ